MGRRVLILATDNIEFLSEIQIKWFRPSEHAPTMAFLGRESASSQAVNFNQTALPGLLL